MTVSKHRLKKVEQSLTARQVVLLWLTEARKAGGSFDAYGRTLMDRADDRVFPREWIHDRVEDAVRNTERGQGREAIEDAVERALRDADFLFFIVHLVHEEITSKSNANALQAALLAMQLKSLLEQDSFANEADRILEYMDNFPYPLDIETAAAVGTASMNRVEPWSRIEGGLDADARQNPIGRQIRDWFLRQGKTPIPPEAYLARGLQEYDDDRPDLRWNFGPTRDELLALFGTEDAAADFVAGQDFSFGLADVRDAEFRQTASAVVQALKDQVAAGKIEKGIEVRFEPGLKYLDFAPLIEGEWIDGQVVFLAEYRAQLKADGFTVADGEDNHPLSPPDAYPPGSAQLFDDEDRAAVDAVREKVRKRLQAFPGRTQVLSASTLVDRPFLNFADYLAWKDRVAEDPIVREGVAVYSLNEWIEANAGRPELAGIPLGWIEAVEPSFTTIPDPTEREAAIQRRKEVIARLRAWRVKKSEVEGRTYVDTRLMSTLLSLSGILEPYTFKTQVADLRSNVMAYASEVFRVQEAVGILQDRFFEGQSILFLEAADSLALQVRAVGEIVGYFNETAAFRLAAYKGRELLTGEQPKADDRAPFPYRSGFRIDLDEVRQLVQPYVADKADEIADLAKGRMLIERDPHEALKLFRKDARKKGGS